MRLLRVLLTLLIVLGTTRAAFAQQPSAPPRVRGVPDEDVSVLPFPPATSTVQPAADIAAPPDLTPFLGQPVAAVDVVVDDMRWTEERPPPILEMRPGDKVTTAIVRRAINEALTSGHFADAHVDLTSEGGKVRATVHVMPRKVIDSIRLETHGAPVEGDELLRDAELSIDGELVARDIPKHIARIEALLQRRGFPSPMVSLSTRPTGDPLRVVLLLDIHVGAPRNIERRVIYPFRGTPEASADAESHYPMKPGARVDEVALEAADATLQARIRGRGFHRADVSHDVVLHKGLVVLRVRVDFGTHYETRYEGNDHFDKATLDDLLDLENETDRTPNHLAQKLKDYYVKHGFLDADVKLETRGTDADPVNYLVFKVTEQRRVYVAARAYPCLREADIKKLSEGGPTSAKGIGSEIDSYLDEELPGNDILVPPNPRGLSETIGPTGFEGTRTVPMELDPSGVYAPETYERAVQHVQELYRSEGFLAAQVGPVQVLRRQCDSRSPPGECRPIRRTDPPPDICTYDAAGLPLTVPPLDPSLSCVPDPARAITCESRVWLRIPIKLGPRTQLWDIAFTGVRALPLTKLADAADVKLGSWVNTVKIDEARRRVADAYKEEGYAFVDVKYTLEPSPDRTRARVRFTVSEGEQVFVRGFVIRGNTYTKNSTIEKRIALVVNQPYRASDVRKTEERIATLGAFASVEVALENPYVPQRNKFVVITVVERPRQYTEVAPGFSTGEGFRIATEYGHRNLFGNAVQFTTRLQLSYIPTVLIIDPTARANYRDLPFIGRLGVRLTSGIVFPDIGLGPLVRGGFDAIVVHDLQRDFFLTKIAAVPNISWRPVNEFQISFFQSFEFNNSRIFNSQSITEYLSTLEGQGFNITDLARQLLVPDGESYVFAQRILASWDRRDNAFNATKGTYVVSGIEHVDAFPLGSRNTDVDKGRTESHFLKFTQTFGGYVCLTHCGGSRNDTSAKPSIRIAALTRIGVNVQLTHGSATYPDRLFFMGGVDSMRGWNLNSFIPQDDVDLIYKTKNLPDFVPDPNNPGQQVPNSAKFTASTNPIQAGNLMANERIELRIPVRGPFETVIFGDMGNLWVDPSYPFDHAAFPIRADIGTGIRVQTPVGPLAVDYGFNVTRQSYEDIGAINFAIGLF